MTVNDQSPLIFYLHWFSGSGREQYSERLEISGAVFKAQRYASV